MTEYTHLVEISKIFFISSILAFISGKVKIPPIVAYIFAGLILGPSVLGLIHDHELIVQLSEIGVIALLFTLGLEFSFDKFKQVGKNTLFIGIFQIVLTILFTGGITKFLGLSYIQSFLLGSIAALSSTVIVMKSLAESAMTDSLQGRIMLGILIIQDLSLIPIMILLDNLKEPSGNILLTLSFAIIKAVVFLSIAILLSLKIAPKIINNIASINKEALLLASIAIAMGTALLSTYFGISIALGAFIAGLALSITAHSKQVIADIVPFRDVFAMVFFVSIGILIDLNFLTNNLALILSTVTLIMIIKFIICFGLVYLFRYSGKIALWTAMSLFQIGEFSFVLAKVGESSKIISKDMYSLIIITASLSMLLTPFFVKITPLIISKLNKKKVWRKYFTFKRTKLNIIEKDNLFNHSIICGYGPIGKTLAKLLSLNDEEYSVIELNNKTVQSLKLQGIPAIYGDATNPDILIHSGVQNAKLAVVTIPDFNTCELAIKNLRELNEDIIIITRAKFQSNIDKLYQAGSNVVIYEEYETSLSMSAEALNSLGYNKEEISSLIYLIRENKCQMLKDVYHNQDFSSGRINVLKNTEIDWIKVNSESKFINKTLSQSDIRSLTGSSVIAMVKKGHNLPNPKPETIIEDNDILVALGTTEQLKKLRELI